MGRFFTTTVLSAVLGVSVMGCRTFLENRPEPAAPESGRIPALKRFLLGDRGPPGHVMMAAGASDLWMQGEYSEQQAVRWAVSGLPEVIPSRDGWQARVVVYQPSVWEGGRETQPARIVVMRGSLGDCPQVLWMVERVLDEGAHVNRLYWGEK